MTADDDNNTDSIVHPAIDYNYIFADPVMGGELSYDMSLLSLSREDGGDVNRIVNQLKWRRQFTDPMGQIITPFMQARGDLYKTTSFTDPKPTTFPRTTRQRSAAPRSRASNTAIPS